MRYLLVVMVALFMIMEYAPAANALVSEVSVGRDVSPLAEHLYRFGALG
jgi:hypothetical protein